MTDEMTRQLFFPDRDTVIVPLEGEKGDEKSPFLTHLTSLKGGRELVENPFYLSLFWNKRGACPGVR